MRDINEIEVNGNLLVNIIAAHAKWAEDANTGSRANLYRADLRRADLRGAYLRRADLRGADLSRANLGGANLGGADLRRADLRGANLRDANLSYADLSDVSLRRANLGGADLRRAYLRRANLGGADLSDADLRGANLRDANLRDANLSRADGIMSFGPVGRHGRIGYAVIFDGTTMFALGCYWGNFDDTCKAIVEKYGENSLYEKQVRLADEILREKMQDIARAALEENK